MFHCLRTTSLLHQWKVLGGVNVGPTYVTIIVQLNTTPSERTVLNHWGEHTLHLFRTITEIPPTHTAPFCGLLLGRNWEGIQEDSMELQPRHRLPI